MTLLRRVFLLNSPGSITLLVFLSFSIPRQEPRSPGLRSLAEPANVHGRRPAALHSDPRIVSWPGQIVPTLPGSHELGGTRCQGRHRRMPVAVPLQEVELLHRRRFHRLRPRLTNRYRISHRYSRCCAQVVVLVVGLITISSLIKKRWRERNKEGGIYNALDGTDVIWQGHNNNERKVRRRRCAPVDFGILRARYRRVRISRHIFIHFHSSLSMAAAHPSSATWWWPDTRVYEWCITAPTCIVRVCCCNGSHWLA